MVNPYVGTEWEASWQQGYDAGLSHPDGQAGVPPLEGNQLTVYNEGVAAGQADAAQGGTPVVIPPPAEPREGVEIPLEATLAFTAAEFAVEWSVQGTIVGLVDLMLHLSIPAGPPPRDMSNPGEMAAALTEACRTMGATDLFMASCQNSGHSGGGDAVLDAGYWHGNLFTDYWNAYRVAVSHLSEEPASDGEVGIVHVTSASPGVEWIQLP
ncbi:hypothetical protein [Microbacterium deminutum]|uniref:Uncharacterized protein n=1 Tax=Microbacterium deminutum TaxID=344164 RepID=A0ABP5CWR1_9MICO